MGLRKFSILFDGPVYRSGQMISGKLVVQVDKPMSLRAITVKYSGKATVSWTETHTRSVTTSNFDGSTSSGSENYTETYSDAEQYLSLQQLILGNNTEDHKLPVGEHVFVFNCQLPCNIPSSFEGRDSHVRYSVKATIQRPWKFNRDTERPFIVEAACDLNHITLAAAPVAEQTIKTFFGHSDLLHMALNLPVRGYVPGQIIPITVIINNNSGVKVKSLQVTLEQNATSHVKKKSKTVKASVCETKIPVPNGLGNEEVHIDLKLPPVPASYLQFCKIIDLSYQLHIEAKVKAWYHRNLKMDTEIIVGNIPLISHAS